MSSEQATFSGFKLNKQLLNAVADAGFVNPTAIQQKAIPQILAGVDLLGIAQTGTGKTAAYLLPVLMKIKFAQEKSPRALIIVPTRELATQVLEHMKILGKYTDLRMAAVYGGVGIKPQIEQIEKGVDILVATPGRMVDLYSAGHLVLKKIQMLILDEAERLLDMGFKRQIDHILGIVPMKKQNLLFSATMSERIRLLTDSFLDRPVVIRIEPERSTAKSVSQILYFAPNLKTKTNLLLYLLTGETFRKTIIFCKTKATASNIGKYMERKFGVEQVRIIHGNKEQTTRMNAVKAFHAGEIKYLVATDVAARGLDILEVSHVINFDVPLVYEDYIHRIGRTGRAFQTGDSITFCSPNDEYHLKKIQKLIGQKIPVAEIPAEVEIAETPNEENQLMLREIDGQRKKDDPEFMGAFQDKKGRKPLPFLSQRRKRT
ncbi:DEAD/DEAH box helicase [soil metagenome]